MFRRAAVLMLVLAACGSDDNAPGAGDATAPSTEIVPKVYSVPSCAMAPTLRTGAKVVVTSSDAPGRGDVVVYRAGPEERVSRVVAVGGDLVETKEGHLVVNGAAVDEPYLAPGTLTGMQQAVDVPSGSYFLLGDNRSISADSRYLGPLPSADVIGKATTLTPGDGC